MTNQTGWERNKRILFDEMVEHYDKARWGYPDELYADIFRYSGPGQGKKALEIGAGTGKATAPFLDSGYDVTAVEMSRKMSGFLLEKFKEYDHFRVLTSTFEEALLDDETYDLVFAATSFHWVDAEIGCPKVFRILKSGGAFALFRSNPVPAIGEEIYEEIQTVYEKTYYRHYPSKERPVRNSREDWMKPSEIRKRFGFDGLARYGFKDVTMKLYHASRTFRADEYIGLLDTFSDHRSLPADLRMALYEGIREVILRHGGHHRVDYVFQLYLGRKRERPIRFHTYAPQNTDGNRCGKFLPVCFLPCKDSIFRSTAPFLHPYERASSLTRLKLNLLSFEIAPSVRLRRQEASERVFPHRCINIRTPFCGTFSRC
jgi:ubiquinone/menaquinone biosynthesis C-methylase UbiE